MKKKELETNFNLIWDKYMIIKADLERTSLREVHLENMMELKEYGMKGKITSVRIVSVLPIVAIIFNHFLPSTYGETIFLVLVLLSILMTWVFTL